MYIYCKKYISLLLLILVESISLYAQQPVVFEQINDKNGRSFGRITGIVQDTSGFIWFSTGQQGLFRYDGYEYINYKHNNADSLSIPNNKITSMYYDRDGILWLRLFDRLIPVRRGKVVKKYKKITDKSFDSDVRIIEDSFNNLWFTSSKTGLLCYHKKTDSITHFRAAFNEYKPAAYDFASGLIRSDKHIAAVKNVGNNTDTLIRFELKQQQSIVIVCAGEQTAWGGDFGFISKNNEVLWEMDFTTAKYMGGDDNFKLLMHEIELPPGTYQLGYKSDESNSAEDWALKGNKPDKLDFYGIALFNAQKNNWKKDYIEDYSRPNTISSDKIGGMAISQHGTLCFVTDKGIDCQNEKTKVFRHIPIDYQKLIGKAEPYITFLFSDSKGKLWIGTDNGLIVFNPENDKFNIIANTATTPNLLTGNLISCATEDHKGNIWMGTTSGLNMLDISNNVIEKFTTTSGNRLDDNFILSVLEDRTGNIWVATKAGLNKMSRQRFFYTPLNISERYYAYPLHYENNKIWFQGLENTLNVLNNKTKNINSYALDAAMFDTESGEGYYIRTIFTDKRGYLWFVSDNGMFCFDKTTSKIIKTIRIDNFNTADGEEIRNRISNVLIKSTTEFLIFALDGIYNYNSNSEKITGFTPFESTQFAADVSDYVIDVLQDANGRIWMRTINGLYLFSPDNNTITAIVEFSNEIIGTSLVYGDIFEDNSGNIWMAVLPKLFRVDKDNNVQEFEFKEAGNVANCRIKADSTNTLWIYTENGLIRFNTDSIRFSKFDINNSGIVDNHIYDAQTDNYNNIWLLTLKGLTKFDTKTFQTESFFTPSDYINIGFVDSKPLNYTGKGEMMFVTTDGLITYYPDSINNKPPPIAITNFVLSKTDYNIEDLVGKDRKLLLEHYQNSFTIEFSALDYTNPDKNKYYCILENYDEEWVEYDVYNRRAVYNKIPPGKYVFKIRAANNDGVWKEETMLHIVLTPPFWKTWWFRMLIILTIVAAVWGLIKVRERKLQYDKRVLEKIVQERTAKIEQQKLEISQQRDEVMKQRDFIVRQNEEIKDSIHYAFRIQKAILPMSENIKKALPENFILYKPRDIVSGDFYWFGQKNDRVIISAADCTGHGVPGAFMSMLGVSFLNEIVIKEEITSPDAILNHLRENVMHALKQTGKDGEAKDGMDISLCSIDLENRKIYFAGAYNPLYIIRNNEMNVYKADKMPIGIYMGAAKKFTLQTIDFLPGDVIYMTSDGYIDQFGGPKGKKYMSKRFKQLLVDIHKLDMEKQREILNETIIEWMSDKYQQIDDIVIVGIRL